METPELYLKAQKESLLLLKCVVGYKDAAAEDPLEEDFPRRRQNVQRYLRNSEQNPSEEEEEHGLQSLGVTRGHTDSKRKKLCLKEAESKKKRAPRLYPRFGGLGTFY